MRHEDLIRKSEDELAHRFAQIDSVADKRLRQVLDAFAEVGLSSLDLQGSTGYGLGDVSRDKLEKVYSLVFGGEASLVRPQMASGTHAIACVLFGFARPGQRIVSITGTPYDTLQEVIGIRPSVGSLTEFGIEYAQTDWGDGGPKDLHLLDHPTSLVIVQRSPGYRPAKAVTIAQLSQWIGVIKQARLDLPVMVDNCYCEFASVLEPGHVGADITVGSLIKNPGGGLALTGGYIVAKKRLIEKIATRVTAPGIGAEVGATWGFMQDAFRGLFLASATTASALKGSLLWAKCFSTLGFEVFPTPDEDRADTVVGIKLDTRERFLKFGKAIQSVSPLNSSATPEPFAQGGYGEPVMLAGGGFVAGGTSDLSCDGLDCGPFWVYVQGGVNLHHVRLGIQAALEAIKSG